MSDTTPSCPKCGAPLPAETPLAGCPACLLEAGVAEDDDLTDLPSAESLAALFPELEIQSLLGRGGMGAVFRARQTQLDRTVALKLLAPRTEREGVAFADRFGREAKALARLDHPGIVRVHDFGARGDLYFLLMEYVDGVSLREAMQDGELRPREALAIVPQICDALQYAHDQGVVHRDIKPENVLIAKDGTVKVADFGLAKIVVGAGDETTLTRAGQVMGTLHYMAPEQVESPASVDHRADIYSLGVVFYELLTGELPIGRFEAPSRRAVLDARLDEVVLRALERKRDRRYQQVSEVKTAVSAIEDPGSGAPRRPTDRDESASAPAYSTAAVLALVTLVLMLLLPPLAGAAAKGLGGDVQGRFLAMANTIGALAFLALVFGVAGYLQTRPGGARGRWMAVVGAVVGVAWAPVLIAGSYYGLDVHGAQQRALDEWRAGLRAERTPTRLRVLDSDGSELPAAPYADDVDALQTLFDHFASSIAEEELTARAALQWMAVTVPDDPNRHADTGWYDRWIERYEPDTYFPLRFLNETESRLQGFEIAEVRYVRADHESARVTLRWRDGRVVFMARRHDGRWRFGSGTVIVEWPSHRSRVQADSAIEPDGRRSRVGESPGAFRLTTTSSEPALPELEAALATRLSHLLGAVAASQADADANPLHELLAPGASMPASRNATEAAGRGRSGLLFVSPDTAELRNFAVDAAHVNGSLGRGGSLAGATGTATATDGETRLTFGFAYDAVRADWFLTTDPVGLSRITDANAEDAPPERIIPAAFHHDGRRISGGEYSNAVRQIELLFDQFAASVAREPLTAEQSLRWLAPAIPPVIDPAVDPVRTALPHHFLGRQVDLDGFQLAELRYTGQRQNEATVVYVRGDERLVFPVTADEAHWSFGMGRVVVDLLDDETAAAGLRVYDHLGTAIPDAAESFDVVAIRQLWDDFVAVASTEPLGVRRAFRWMDGVFRDREMSDEAAETLTTQIRAQLEDGAGAGWELGLPPLFMDAAEPRLAGFEITEVRFTNENRVRAVVTATRADGRLVFPVTGSMELWLFGNGRVTVRWPTDPVAVDAVPEAEVPEEETPEDAPPDDATRGPR